MLLVFGITFLFFLTAKEAVPGVQGAADADFLNLALLVGDIFLLIELDYVRKPPQNYVHNFF